MGVSKSTLSIWLRNVALTDEHRLTLATRASTAREQRAGVRRALRDRRNDVIGRGARQQITDLSERELFVAGVVAYWAEGSKSKPWRSSQVVFTTPTPG